MARKNETATVETPAVEATAETAETVARGRVKEPFGRGFNLTIKFHDEMTDDRRNAIVATLLGDVQSNNSKRFTRGDAENENQQTWRIADAEYIWPEQAEPVKRGLRLENGPLAEMIRKLAKQNGISPEQALLSLLGDKVQVPEVK